MPDEQKIKVVEMFMDGELIGLTSMESLGLVRIQECLISLY